ncbi:MAG: hypothetical protein U0Z26_05695 [Anaerolineales bacterium]
MENTTATESKPPKRSRDRAMFFIGVLAMLCSCAFFIGAVTLDIIGKPAIGKLSNAASGNCSAGKTCWTGKMEFTTQSGKHITFYPLTAPMLFDFDPFLSGRPYEKYGEYQVRYLEAFPQIAKVKLAFFLEYGNTLCGLGIGVFLFLLSYLFSSSGSGKPHKPIVIDLSKRKK